MDAGVTLNSLVLDSWPILEWLKGREPGSILFDEIVTMAQSGSLQLEMSRLNYGEVIYTIRKAPDIADRGAALSTLLALPIRLHSIDDALVDEAVELKARYPIAYADAFAAALGARLDVAVVTGDLEFRRLEADGLLALRWVGA